MKIEKMCTDLKYFLVMSYNKAYITTRIYSYWSIEETRNKLCIMVDEVVIIRFRNFKNPPIYQYNKDT